MNGLKLLSLGGLDLFTMGPPFPFLAGETDIFSTGENDLRLARLGEGLLVFFLEKSVGLILRPLRPGDGESRYFRRTDRS